MNVPLTLRSVLAAASLALLGPAAFAQSGEQACGSLENAYGPFDYRTVPREKLHLVERYHFTPQVEGLVHGKSGTRLGGDLDYTLRAFPNHHRALLAVMRYGQRTRSPQPPDLPRPVECYFERAVRFRPDDALTHMIYAQFLAASQRRGEAKRQLELADAAAGDNGFSHYNIGMLYFDLESYPQALAQAHEAAKLGFMQSGLKDKLKKVGQWREAGAGTPSSAASMPRSDAASAPQ